MKIEDEIVWAMTAGRLICMGFMAVAALVAWIVGLAIELIGQIFA